MSNIRILTILTCLPLIIANLFYLQMAPFGSLFTLGALCLFVLTLLGLIINLCLKAIRRATQDYVPVIICILTIIITVIFPLGELNRRVDFSTNHSTRKEVVELIELGEVKEETNNTDGYSWAKVPPKYQKLSEDGEVQIFRNQNVLQVRFVLYQTWFDNFEGIVYSSDGKDPSKSRLFPESSYVRCEPKAPKWFWYYQD